MTLRRREFLGSLATSLAAGAKSPQPDELSRLALLPQDVGMGARNGSDKRFEAAYILEVETPHVKWANPLPGGPIHLLAVPTVGEGRTIVELAQRVSLYLTTVSIDPNWDVNKWTMAFGTDYGARAEKGDLKLVYSYLERELTSAKHFDAVLLPLNHGWNKLTPASRDALARRVNEGCGLVLIRPDGELSPLSPVDISTSGDPEFDEREPVARTESSPWHRTGDHYISRAIPVEKFPFGDVQNFICRLAPDATVLIRSDSGNPGLAVRQSEKGRVVAFGYRNQGMSWQMPISARGHFVDVCWEYFTQCWCAPSFTPRLGSPNPFRISRPGKQCGGFVTSTTGCCNPVTAILHNSQISRPGATSSNISFRKTGSSRPLKPGSLKKLRLSS